MTYYDWIMIIFGILGTIGSAILFGIKVLRYLWRIELAVESLVEQNKTIIEENKIRDEKLQTIELKIENFDSFENIEKLTRKRFLAG